MSIEPILEKIQKLSALADSPNVNEAANAARMIRKLMMNYDISEAQLMEASTVDKKSDDIGFMFCANDPSIDQWRVTIWVSCAKLYMCRMVKEGADQIGVVGRSHHADVCRRMIWYLEATLEKNFKAAKKLDKTLQKAGYRLGWALAIRDKIKQIQEGDTQQERALVVQEDTVLSKYMKDRYGDGRNAHVRSPSVDGSSYSLGQVDGKKVSLNAQLER